MSLFTLNAAASDQISIPGRTSFLAIGLPPTNKLTAPSRMTRTKFEIVMNNRKRCDEGARLLRSRSGYVDGESRGADRSRGILIEFRLRHRVSLHASASSEDREWSVMFMITRTRSAFGLDSEQRNRVFTHHRLQKKPDRRHKWRRRVGVVAPVREHPTSRVNSRG